MAPIIFALTSISFLWANLVAGRVVFRARVTKTTPSTIELRIKGSDTELTGEESNKIKS